MGFVNAWSDDINDHLQNILIFFSRHVFHMIPSVSHFAGLTLQCTGTMGFSTHLLSRNTYVHPIEVLAAVISCLYIHAQ